MKHGDTEVTENKVEMVFSSSDSVFCTFGGRAYFSALVFDFSTFRKYEPRISTNSRASRKFFRGHCDHIEESGSFSRNILAEEAVLFAKSMKGKDLE
jgi:hypothetical protein